MAETIGKMNNVWWKLKSFQELSNEELYQMMRLRLEVFVLEQNCVYQDADGKDLQALHLMGHDTEGDLVAYARILPAGISYREASIGRIVTSKKARGNGTGKQLMSKAMECIKEKMGDVSVKISAQSYLQKFYEVFGFEVSGNEYQEDGIPHIAMIYNATKR